MRLGEFTVNGISEYGAWTKEYYFGNGACYCKTTLRKREFTVKISTQEYTQAREKYFKKGIDKSNKTCYNTYIR